MMPDQTSVASSNKRQVKPEVLAALANMDADFQPQVVKYNPDQVMAPPEPKKPEIIRKPPVPAAPARRATSQHSKAAMNAGRQIMSQGSGSVKNLKDAVPKSNQTLKLKEREDKNYIKANLNKVVFDMKPDGRQSADGQSRSGAAAANANAQHKNYGKVPSYLNKYKNEREEALKQKALDEEAAKFPPGTRLMPEDERQATLKDLREAHEETTRQLGKLPVVAHSGKMERHKTELE